MLLDQVRASVSTGSAAASAPVVEKGISKGAAYQKRQKELRYQAALLIQAALKRGNVQLTSEEQKAIELLTRKPGSGSPHSFGEPIIFRLFGNPPKAGSKISALQAFEKTGKGFQEMKQLIKKWAKQGNVVVFDAASKTYTLQSVGSLPASGDNEGDEE